MGFQRKPTDAAKSVAAYSSSVRWCGRLIPVSKLTGYKTLLPTEAVGYISLVGSEADEADDGSPYGDLLADS